MITQVNGTQLTLLEADGRVQPITLAEHDEGHPPGDEPPAVRARAEAGTCSSTWPATGPALFVDVEKIPKARGKAVGALRRVIVNQLFGPKMVRAQILEKNGGPVEPRPRGRSLW